jgi:hypothetical protein
MSKRTTTTILVLIACICIATISLIVLPRSVAQVNDGDPGGPWSPEVREVVHAIGAQSFVYLDALPPPGEGAPVRGLVSDYSLTDAMRWIRIIVREEHLPDQLKERLVAHKDVEKLVRRDQQGRAFSRDIRDILLLRNGPILLQENGSSVSLLVPLPEPVELDAENLLNVVKSQLIEYLDYPADKLDQLRLVAEQQGPVHFGHVTTREVDPKLPDVMLDPQNPFCPHWREQVNFLTDGKTIFLDIGKHDGSPVMMRPSPGLPNRF